VCFVLVSYGKPEVQRMSHSLVYERTSGMVVGAVVGEAILEGASGAGWPGQYFYSRGRCPPSTVRPVEEQGSRAGRRGRKMCDRRNHNRGPHPNRRGGNCRRCALKADAEMCTGSCSEGKGGGGKVGGTARKRRRGRFST